MVHKRPRTDSNVAHIEFSSHRKEILSGLDHLRAQHLLLDVTLVAEGSEELAHKAVLAACSEYFRAMFTTCLGDCHGESKKIHLNGVTANGLRLLVNFAYTSHLSLSMENVEDVLVAADYLQMYRVSRVCARFLRSQLRLSNALLTLNVAERYSLVELKQYIYRFLCNNLTAFVKAGDFTNLSIEQLFRMLDGTFPVDCTEYFIICMVIKWIEHDKVNRIVYTKQLFEAVNYDTVPKDDLVELARTSGLFRHVTGQFRKEIIAIDHKYSLEQLSDELPANPRGFECCMVTIGGFHAGEITNKIMYYHEHDSHWRVLTDIPHVEQCNFGVAVLRNKLYIVGGCFNQSLQENIHPFGFYYDPRTDRWATIRPMTQERCRFYLGMVDGRMYAIGGAEETTNNALEESSSSSSCECYNPDDDQWSSVRALPSRRVQHAGATWKHSIFICGGLENDSITQSLLCYDTLTDTWQQKSSMVRPRADHCMILFENKLVVAGGWHEDEATGTRIIAETLDCYDIETDSWTVASRVPTPRYHGTMLQFKRKIYIVGGFTGDRKPTRDIMCYDPDTDSWSMEGEYPEDIWEHSSCSLYVPRCTIATSFEGIY